jgi:hypothetical protein
MTQKAKANTTFASYSFNKGQINKKRRWNESSVKKCREEARKRTPELIKIDK